MVQACTLFLSRVGRFGLGLLTLALTNLRGGDTFIEVRVQAVRL